MGEDFSGLVFWISVGLRLHPGSSSLLRPGSCALFTVFVEADRAKVVLGIRVSFVYFFLCPFFFCLPPFFYLDFD